MFESSYGAPFIVVAEPHDDYSVTLTFEGGERHDFDLKPHLNTEVFSPLRDLELFIRVKVVYGSLKRPRERGLAHDMLYAESVPVNGPASI